MLVTLTSLKHHHKATKLVIVHTRRVKSRKQGPVQQQPSQHTQRGATAHLQWRVTQHLLELLLADWVVLQHVHDEHVEHLCLHACVATHTCRVVHDDAAEAEAHGEKRAGETILKCHSCRDALRRVVVGMLFRGCIR